MNINHLSKATRNKLGIIKDRLNLPQTEAGELIDKIFDIFLNLLDDVEKVIKNYIKLMEFQKDYSDIVLNIQKKYLLSKLK